MQQQASRQKRNLKVDLGKCVQMYRAPFLYLPGAPNSLNPPLILNKTVFININNLTVSVVRQWDEYEIVTETRPIKTT